MRRVRRQDAFLELTEIYRSNVFIPRPLLCHCPEPVVVVALKPTGLFQDDIWIMGLPYPSLADWWVGQAIAAAIALLGEALGESETLGLP